MRPRGLLIVAGIVIVAILVAVAGIGRFAQAVGDHKAGRDTTGVVVGKKHVQFDSDQTTYLDYEGRTRILEDWRRRDGEFRVFYTIDNFDDVPPRAQVSLAGAEEARFKKYGPRYTIVNAQEFERIAVGQRIEIVFRWASDSQIEMIDVELKAPGTAPSKQ
jgi:hypothetical protein